MVGEYKVITLCGSVKFREEFLREQERLTLQGNIVLSVVPFEYLTPSDLDATTKAMLSDMYKRKIDLSDEIFVINKNGYIGESTKSEIEYAIAMGKKVSYLES